MSGSTSIPLVMTTAGAQPTPPATLQQAIIAGVTPTNADYTATLPASLIEDTLDTEIAGAVLIDQAKVETVNSLTPYGANDYLLIELGNQAGITQAGATNTSVYVVFSGTPGFVIVQGFVVSDGTYQYVVQAPGGIIGASGTTQSLFAIATQAGSWAVPSGSVTQPITPVPTAILNAGFSVDNPVAGTPGGAAQSATSFRQSVLQANYAIVQGAQSLLKTQLAKVPNVQAQLVSVAQQPNGGGWEVIVGGGDPYLVAYAIYRGIGDVSSLVGSVLNITAIGNGLPTHITTDKNHGYTNGQETTPSGIVGGGNLEELNNQTFTVTVISDTEISVNFAASGTYVGDGTLLPNPRNMTVAINDFPDVYNVIFVNPPAVTVAISVTWNTISTSFVSDAAVSQLAGPALANYVNMLTVGQPMNLLELEQVFLEAVAGVLPGSLISSLSFSVSINGIGVSPVGKLFYAEPNSSVQESYFTTNTGLITIAQG